MREDDYIVSRTDLKGHITYGNRIFIEFSGYTEKELLGTQNQNTATPGKSTGNRSFMLKDNSIDDPSQTTQEPTIYRHLARYMVEVICF